MQLLLIDLCHRNWYNFISSLSFCFIRSGELCSGSTLLHQVHTSWTKCMYHKFGSGWLEFRKYPDFFNISLQNVVAWTNLGTLYLKKDNIEVCVINFLMCSFCFYPSWLKFSLLKSGLVFLACTQGLQDCPVPGTALCQLLDRTGTKTSRDNV